MEHTITLSEETYQILCKLAEKGKCTPEEYIELTIESDYADLLGLGISARDYLLKQKAVEEYKAKQARLET